MSQHSRNPSTTTAASSQPGSVREITAGPNMSSAFSDYSSSAASIQRGRPYSIISNDNRLHAHLQGYSPERPQQPPAYTPSSDRAVAVHSRAPSYEASQQEAATAASSNQPRNSFYGTPGRPIIGLTSTATAAAEADQSSNGDASSAHMTEDLYSTYADATRLSDAHYEGRRRDATQQRRAHQPRTGGSTPLNNPPRL
ncbi:uncharacterized protein L199_007556 [Kwoniella botswanensis]|uniref:uncharacterized protein n=1 Tax=Kwoniella botswanensis TaxID=1268659 RepID=UPI00315C69D2